jgi:hypothetical protein
MAFIPPYPRYITVYKRKSLAVTLSVPLVVGCFNDSIDTPSTTGPADHTSQVPVNEGNVQPHAHFDWATIMSRPTDVEFVETPLKDVLEYLADMNRVQIVVDDNIIQGGGMNTGQRVTRRFSNMALGEILEQTLTPLSLECVPDGTRLRILKKSK